MKKYFLLIALLLLCVSLLFALRIPDASLFHRVQVNTPQPLPLAEDSAFCGKTASSEWLRFRGGSSNAYYRVDTLSRTCDLYLEVEAGNYIPPAAEQRLPVNLSIVIDRSGSMGNGKLAYALQSAQFVVDQLNGNDYLSIVTYDDGVLVPISSGAVTDKERIKKAISRIGTGGSTNLCGGMMEGYQQCRNTWQSGRVNKVLLLSDGLANVGIISTEEISRIAHNQDNQNAIAISTFGIGIDYNEDLMTRIAESGNGNYYFIAEANQIPDIFRKELDGLLKVVAQNARLEIDIPQGMSLNKSFGNSYILENGKAIVNLRDIYSQEKKAVMLRFNLSDNWNGDLHLDARFVYDDAIAHLTNQVMPLSFDLRPVTGAKAYAEGNQNCILRQVILFEANDRLELAMREMENGNYSQAQGYLQMNTAVITKASSDIGMDKDLQKMETLNEEYKTKSKDYQSMSQSEQKILQKSSKEKSYEVRKKK